MSIDKVDYINVDGSERMRLIRKKLDLTQAEFAKHIDIAEHKIKSIETGKTKISTEIALLIEEYFNFSFKWVLTGRGEMINSFDQSNKADCASFKLSPTIDNHIEIAKKFEDHESALLANEYLVNMEKKSPKDFLLAVGYLKGVSDSIDRKSQDQTDRRKRTMDWESPERRKKTAS